LPREIALRQKQYEYYRDLLLSFPKMEEEQWASDRKECRICKASFLMS
jgi:type I restriction enzyme S subunit